MPSQFPYLPKYIYILISQIQSKYIFVLLCVCYLYHGFTANSPTLYLFASSFFLNLFVPLLSLLFPHLIHERLFCHSDQISDLLHFRNSFSVGHSRYECYYYYSYPMKKSWKMGTYCCGWDGVTCDTMTGHVIGLDLSCSGKSPTTISKGKFQSHLESLSH